MNSSSTLIFFVLSLTYFSACQCSTNTTNISLEKRNTEVVENLARTFKNIWTWIKQQAGAEDTFVGRCAGALKKFGMAINFIIFKLGVIVTALAFLAVLAFKSLGVGVLILIISSIGLSSKLFALKGGGGHESPHNGAVHLHLYNKGGNGGGHYLDHPPDHHSGWYDRLDHIVPKNELERMAIADLYKRLKISEGLYGTANVGTDTYR